MKHRAWRSLALAVLAMVATWPVLGTAEADVLPPASDAVRIVHRDGIDFTCRPLPANMAEPPPSGLGAPLEPAKPICDDGWAPEPLRVENLTPKGPPPSAAPPHAPGTNCPTFADGCYYYAQQDVWEPSTAGVYAMTAHQTVEAPYVDPHGHSIGQLWALDTDDGTRPMSTIEVGWRVERADGSPRLFVYRFDDGAPTCYLNMDCASTATDCWQPAAGASKVPNQYITHSNGLAYQFSINAGSNGSWWVGFDNQWLGYYIGTSENGVNCWTRRPDNLNFIAMGGEVFSANASPTHNNPCTDMGNGQLGTSTTAAGFDQTWRSLSNPNTSIYNNDATSTTVAPYTTGFFHSANVGDFRYGGPGHCGPTNRAPSVSLTVSHTQGMASQGITLGTVFTAWLDASDPDGDDITTRIDWGDGVTSWNTDTATHTYSQPGNYTIVGRATDRFGVSRTSSRAVRVCTAAAAGACV